MANTFGVLNNSNIIHDAGEHFIAQLPDLTNMAIDVSATIGGRYAKPGDTVNVRNLSKPFTTYAVTAAGYVAPDYNELPSYAITLPNTPTAVSLRITPEQYRILEDGGSDAKAYNSFLKVINTKMIEALATSVTAQFMAKVTAASFPNTYPSAPGTFSIADEINLTKQFYDLKVNDINPSLYLHPAAYAEWVKDHQPLQTNWGGQPRNPSAWRGGLKGTASNFTVWTTNHPMPADAARGFAAAPDSMLVVNRIPDEPLKALPERAVSYAEYIDGGAEGRQGTGIGFLARLWGDNQTGALQLDFSTIFEFAKAESACLIRIV